MNTQKSLSLAAWVSLISLALIWGASFLSFAIGLRELPVFTLVAHRVFWGALALWGVVFALRIPLPANLKTWGALLIMGLLNNAIPFSLIAWGQTYIESGLASIINGSTAIFGILIAALVFTDERLTGRKMIGVFIAFLGVCITIGWQALQNFDIRSLAQLALLGASFAYGMAASWGRHALRGLHPIMAATGMLTGAAIIMVPLALFTDGLPRFDLMPATIGAVFFLAIPATSIAYLLYYRALNLAGSGNLSLVTLLVPPTAVFWGAVVLDEALPASAYLGFAIIALGMIILDGRVFRRITR
jgi:drug/metabolite transporter (DMT)-like permease